MELNKFSTDTTSSNSASPKCLLCLGNADRTFHIFSEEGVRLKVGHIIIKHFNFLQINDNDPSDDSSRICINCWLFVNNFHEFYEKVKSLCNDKNELKEIKVEVVDQFHPPPSPTSISLEKSNMKCERFSTTTTVEDDDFNNEDEKEENIELVEPTKPSPTSRKRDKLRKEKLIFKKTKEAVQSKSMDENILYYVSLDCTECDYKSTMFGDFLSHSRLKHGTQGYVYCCKKKFKERSKMIDHIKWHQNPDMYKCNECDKSFVSRFSYKTHLANRHVSVADRPYQCPKCTKKFAKPFLLGQHLRMGHVDGSHFECDICSKKFRTKHVLQKHLISTHSGLPPATEMCYICAKEYKSKGSLRWHMMENHPDSERPKVECHICGACFSNELYLKRHIQRHNNRTEMLCPLCSKVSFSKAALGAHIRNTHSERSHKCTFCEKAFRNKKVLTEHIAVHTGQDLYSCSYCPMTFKSNANMSSHRKKVHPNEWEANRLKRLTKS